MKNTFISRIYKYSIPVICAFIYLVSLFLLNSIDKYLSVDSIQDDVHVSNMLIFYVAALFTFIAYVLMPIFSFLYRKKAFLFNLFAIVVIVVPPTLMVVNDVFFKETRENFSGFLRSIYLWYSLFVFYSLPYIILIKRVLKKEVRV